MLIKCADETAVPAGQALAVDREKFAKLVTEKMEKNPNIEVIRKEVVEYNKNDRNYNYSNRAINIRKNV